MNSAVLSLKSFLPVGILFFASSVFASPSLDEPGVTITPKGDGQRIEYRINGKLYMVKVTPTKGPSYYLLDTDGDGVLETRRHRMEGDGISNPQWKVFQWK